jgi:site-specific DNA recombinase
VVLRAGSILIHPRSDEGHPIEIAWSPRAPSGRREILVADGGTNHERGIKPEARIVLLRSIALGRRWLDEVLAGTTGDEIVARERCTSRHVMNTISLAFLAPEIVRAVIEARLPRGISARAIGDPELEWSRQWSALGPTGR